MNPQNQRPTNVTIDDLVQQYEVILLDAYGVLVDDANVLPGASALISHIEQAGRSFLIVTNDASCQPETIATRFERLNLPIPAEKIITSGSLIPSYFADNSLRGARTMVLGPEDSFGYVESAGGVLTPIHADSEIDALVITSGAGFPFVNGIEIALGAVVRQIRNDRPVTLVLPNPDVIYPKAGHRYGFTAGAVAMLIEAGLARVFPERNLRFVSLGKPYRFMFDQARKRAGTDRVVMVGDQLHTDIAGANAAEIASALIDTGLCEWNGGDDALRPDYLLRAPQG